MAIDIKVSGGVDFNAYLADFAATFEAAGRGAFSQGLSGDEYTLWSGSDTTLPVEDGQAFVVESGDAGDLAYDFMTHTVGGTIDAIDFGNGVTDTGGGDYETDSEVLFSGLDLSSTGADGIVNRLVLDLMEGNTDVLMSLLKNADLNFEGSDENDAFRGFKGNDSIDGGAGNDKLNGGQGNDTLIGGEGNDVLIGGSGKDVFVFGANSGKDVINDFEAGKGATDVISFMDGQFKNFKDLMGSVHENSKGATIITIDDDTSIKLKDVSIADLHKDDFLFA